MWTVTVKQNIGVMTEGPLVFPSSYTADLIFNDNKRYSATARTPALALIALGQHWQAVHEQQVAEHG